MWRLDRLGRSLPHLVATINDLDARGVRVQSLHDPIDTRSASGRMQLNIFATLTQLPEGRLLSLNPPIGEGVSLR